jgi:plasmid maintenance system killer protein
MINHFRDQWLEDFFLYGKSSNVILLALKQLWRESWILSMQQHLTGICDRHRAICTKH